MAFAYHTILFCVLISCEQIKRTQSNKKNVLYPKEICYKYRPKDILTYSIETYHLIKKNKTQSENQAKKKATVIF